MLANFLVTSRDVFDNNVVIEAESTSQVFPPPPWFPRGGRGSLSLVLIGRDRTFQRIRTGGIRIMLMG